MQTATNNGKGFTVRESVIVYDTLPLKYPTSELIVCTTLKCLENSHNSVSVLYCASFAIATGQRPNGGPTGDSLTPKPEKGLIFALYGYLLTFLTLQFGREKGVHVS